MNLGLVGCLFVGCESPGETKLGVHANVRVSLGSWASQAPLKPSVSTKHWREIETGEEQAEAIQTRLRSTAWPGGSLKHTVGEVRSWQSIRMPRKASFPSWVWNGVHSAPPNMVVLLVLPNLGNLQSPCSQSVTLKMSITSTSILSKGTCKEGKVPESPE